MNWGKKPEDKPAEKPAETTAETATQDEMLAKLRTSFEEVIKPMREKIDSYETRFSTIEDATRRPAPKQENSEIPSVLDGDEDAAFRMRLAPIETTVSQLAGQLIEDRVVGDITTQGWGELVPQLRKMLSEIHPNYKSQPGYETSVRKIAFSLIGESAVNGGLKRDAGKNTWFIEDAGGAPAAGTTTRMSSEDQRVMDKLGIKDKEAFYKSVVQ